MENKGRAFTGNYRSDRLKMVKHRIYLDTSVIGGYYDIEFEEWSKKLIQEIRDGKKVAVISDLTLKELEPAPRQVGDLAEELPKELIASTEESEELAKKYVEAGGLSPKSITDAEHIALATIGNVDILASWNFEHIVKLWRIQIFNGVNLMNGYKALEIRSPREITDE